MEQSDAKAPKLPQPKVLTDKFNRVIKTEEDFRIGMRRGADGVNRWYRNGKLVREETEDEARRDHRAIPSGSCGYDDEESLQVSAHVQLGQRLDGSLAG
jgi:hypothetical protein